MMTPDTGMHGVRMSWQDKHFSRIMRIDHQLVSIIGHHAEEDD